MAEEWPLRTVRIILKSEKGERRKSNHNEKKQPTPKIDNT